MQNVKMIINLYFQSVYQGDLSVLMLNLLLDWTCYHIRVALFLCTISLWLGLTTRNDWLFPEPSDR